MQRTTRRMAATTTAAAVLLLGLPAPPASATSVKKVVFSGTAMLSAGLGYPGVGPAGADPTKVPCTEKGTPIVCVHVDDGPKGGPVPMWDDIGGNTSELYFESTACTKNSVAADSTKKVPGPAFCTLQAFGIVWGFCGMLTGWGIGAVTNQGLPFLTGPLKSTTSFDFDVMGVGGLLVITGGDADTNVSGEAFAVPTGGSCTNKTAVQFSLTGKLAIKECTPGSPEYEACTRTLP